MIHFLHFNSACGSIKTVGTPAKTSFRAGVPTSRIWSLVPWGGADVIIIEIECTINAMCLNHQETIPYPCPDSWKNCLPRNWSLVPKRWGITVEVSQSFEIISNMACLALICMCSRVLICRRTWVHIQAAEGMEIIYAGAAEWVNVNHFCLPSPSVSIYVIPCGQAAEPSIEDIRVTKIFMFFAPKTFVPIWVL